MKIITIKLMQFQLQRAKKQQAKEKNPIVLKAYSKLIKNYEYTIMYLKSTN